MIARYGWLVGLLGSLLGMLATLHATPPPERREAPTEAQSAPPTNERERWAIDILAGLGNRQPSAETIAFVVAWTVAEDGREGPGTALARNNVLNTTQQGYNETTTINGDGVKGYATYQDGLAATLQTLSYGYYTEIVAGLQTNDPERALRGLYASPWGTDARNVETLWRR